MRVCSVHGCPTVFNGTDSRCPKHQGEADQKHWANTRAYSTREHRAFRAAVLERDPVCVICRTEPSTVADHYPLERTDLIARGMNPNEPAYGRGLCAPCHNQHTATSHPAGWHARP
jgi:5-methylcytosine-specific restriction protein A